MSQWFSIPGAHALEPGNLFGFLVVRRPHQMTLKGAGSAQNALKLQAGDHIGQGGVLIPVVLLGIVRGKARGQDHRADVNLPDLALLVEVHGAGGTEFLTGLAFAALFEVNAGVLVNGKFQRHRLGIKHIGGFAVTQPLVEFIGNFLGALLGADAAGDAFGRVDEPGPLLHGYLEIPRLTGDSRDL